MSEGSLGSLLIVGSCTPMGSHEQPGRVKPALLEKGEKMEKIDRDALKKFLVDAWEKASTGNYIQSEQIPAVQALAEMSNADLLAERIEANTAAIQVQIQVAREANDLARNRRV